MAFDLKGFFSSLSFGGSQVPERSIGIDIGASSIKIVEIENAKKALTLKTYGELQLGPYGDHKLGEIVKLEPEKKMEALVDVMRESNAMAKTGVLAIPLTSSFVTVVPISVHEDENLEGKIRIEARKYIPVPLSEVILDWIQLNEYSDKEVTVYEILLAAIQKDAFERLQNIMTNVELSSQPPEIEVFSCIRGLYREDVASMAIIDLGAETNKLYITKKGALERIHRVYDGGATCTSRLAQLLNVPFEEAENLKRIQSTEDEHYRDVHKAYVSSVERSAQEFKRVLEQYEARIGSPVQQVVLTGGGASYIGAKQVFTDMFSREVITADPFSRVAYPAFLADTAKEIGPSFSVALGAALRPYE